jgi:hypothetical protein
MTYRASFIALPTAGPDQHLAAVIAASGRSTVTYREGVVSSFQAYGWTTNIFVDLLGVQWLDHGWVDLALKKATYEGETIEVSIATRKGGKFEVTNQKDVCLKGDMGLGQAPWLNNIRHTRLTRTLPSPEPLAILSLELAPLKRNLIPMTVSLSVADNEHYIKNQLGELLPIYQGEGGRCHPAWLAGRLTDLLHHSYNYGPAIHTHSKIQNLAPALAGQTFTVTGYCHDAYERNGHHYIENDGSIWAEDGTEVCRLRHTAIFKLKESGSH